MLNFEPEERLSRFGRIGPFRVFLAAAFSFLLVVGYTYAANINLNSNQSVEFGQGVTQTTACDDSVLLTPYSTFVNEPGGGQFMFTSLTVEDISEECEGKIFVIKAYEEGDDEALALYTTAETTDYYELQVAFDGETFTFVEEVTGLDGDDITTNEDSDGFTVELFTAGPPPSEAAALASEVDRITIESRDGAGESLSEGIPPAGTYDCKGTTPVDDIREEIVVSASDLPITYTFVDCDWYLLYSSMDGKYPSVIEPICQSNISLGHCTPGDGKGIPSTNQVVQISEDNFGTLIIYAEYQRYYSWNFVIVP